MKKQFAILLVGCTSCGTALGATIDWWNQQTICRINDTKCYGGITAGMDYGWDETANCRGRKYVCANALTTGGTDAVAKNRADILHYNGISSDFDIDVYVPAEKCYGVRKTSQNGAMVLVNGEYVRVWCNGLWEAGILPDPPQSEQVANGVITFADTPKCADLARENYVATLNGKCYGKHYDPNKYAIDCDGENPIIVVLNGAQYTPNVDNFITTFMANARFSAMQTSAATQRSIHFPK